MANYAEILDANDWDKWCDKYIDPLLRKGEYELIVDEEAPSVLVFPLFKEQFCKDLIELCETEGEWTVDRHEFYPTTDMLIDKVWMGQIYRKVINDFVRPLAIWFWKLEGRQWETLTDETFIVKYTTDTQAHLSLHHDSSDLTTVVKMNDDFTGGGTYFSLYKKTITPPRVGMAALHPGAITHRHGARPVHSGTRYITVSFCKMDR